MVRKTDDSENMEFHGILTMLPSIGSNGGGDGSLEISGKVYTDYIQGNLENGPVDINGISIGNGNITITNTSETGITPSTGNHLFYVKDNLLQSLNSTGNLTVYQPTNTKGDLISHDGTKQIRIPIGADGYFLKADSTSNSGLTWANSGTVSTNFKKEITLINSGSNNAAIMYDKIYLPIFSSITSQVNSGASGVLLFSKSKDSDYGQFTRITGTPSLSSGNNIDGLYNNYEAPKVYKTSSEGDGVYSLSTNTDYARTMVTLSNTTWTSLGANYTVLTGAFFITIYSDTTDCPSGSFLICKSFSDCICPAINKLSSSPGTNACNLELRWTASNGIELRKTSNDNNAIYNVVDNFIQSTSTSINLSSSVPILLNSSLFRFYEKKNIVIRIVSNNIQNSPCSIIFISKNNKLTNGSKYCLFSPGKNTLEKILVNWDTNSLLSINKTGVNYDGEYVINFFHN